MEATQSAIGLDRVPRGWLVSIAMMIGVAAGSLPAAGLERAELPRYRVETEVTSPGEVIRVRAGEDFQAALERARPGDVIELQAGAVFVGPFVLPHKSESRDPASQWITIRSGRGQAELPPAGVRVSPADAPAMARLETASGAVVSAAPGANHYRFVGIEFQPAAAPSHVSTTGHFLDALISLTAEEAAGEPVPHHVIIERCYVHGDPRVGARRGIVLNSAATAVVDSWLSDFKMAGGDSQALIGWEGPGPYRIENNYLEAAGENLMFGGADPVIRDRVPADIEIRGNHFAKPVAWKAGSPGYAGTAWTIKNLLELKNARRVLVDGNVFEYNWPESQNGFAILFTVRNQDGSAPWSVVEDITFSNNVVRHVANGINVLGQDDNHPSDQVRRVLIRNNLFADVGGSWGGGDLLQILDGTEHVIFEHNTALHTGNILIAEGRPHRGFQFRGNIVSHNRYGMTGTDSAPGTAVLERYFAAAVVRDNLIAGGPAERYPPGNAFPESLAAAGLIDAAGGDFRLTAASPHRVAGSVPGVDFGELCAALSVTERPPFCVAVPSP